ncbi:MAG: glycosyltransferase family 2 protein [Candidatus Dormibacteria bacterium]
MPEPALVTAVRVVICTYQSASEVADAISSCLDQGLAQEQLTVVDNHSSDGTPEVVAGQFPGVRLMSLRRNLGFAAAVNRGAEGSGGEFVLLLNPDARLAGGALDHMVIALLADPLRGAVSPRILRPDGALDRACRRTFPSPEIAVYRLLGLSRLLPRSARMGAYNLTHISPELPMVVDSGSGACLLVRRQVWDQVGGLDEGYFMYGEDLELCWQIRELGRHVWYEPSASVLHLKGRSSEKAALAMLVHFHYSMWRFYSRHYRRGAQGWLAPLVGLGIAARLLALLVLNSLRKRPRVSP